MDVKDIQQILNRFFQFDRGSRFTGVTYSVKPDCRVEINGKSVRRFRAERNDPNLITIDLSLTNGTSETLTHDKITEIQGFSLTCWFKETTPPTKTEGGSGVQVLG